MAWGIDYDTHHIVGTSFNPKEKNMSQRDLARKLGKSEAVVSRWTTGLPNLTLRSIAELSTALGEPLIQVTK